MNRHERRKQQALIRAASRVARKNMLRRPPESIPTDNPYPYEERHPESLCDWDSCTNAWAFVTHAGPKSRRVPVAKRCAEHRLA